MAVSKTDVLVPPVVVGNLWLAVATVTFDNSYAAGGEAFALKELGFGIEAEHLFSFVLPKNLSEQAIFQPAQGSYDGTKLHLYDNATGKELAGEKDVSKVTATVAVFCQRN